MYAHACAPIRIGIAGGGTDLPVWTSPQDGSAPRIGYCFSLAIETYVHAVAITRPDGQVVASYRNRDEAAAATEIANGLIRESALLHGWLDSFEVHTLSEVTSQGSGLGVSSAIAVALSALFSRMSKLRSGDLNDSVELAQIASDAWAVEIDRLKRPIGRQDHMAATWGGLRLYSFEGSTAKVERVFSAEDAQWVARSLVLFKLPEGHDSRAILSNVKRQTQLQTAFEAVPIAMEAIERRDLSRLGKAMELGHASKMSIAGAVPTKIREVVRAVRGVDGVFGCKIAGAGGGGHLITVCESKAVGALEEVMQSRAIVVQPALSGVRSEGWV